MTRVRTPSAWSFLDSAATWTQRPAKAGAAVGAGTVGVGGTGVGTGGSGTWVAARLTAGDFPGAFVVRE